MSTQLEELLIVFSAFYGMLLGVYFFVGAALSFWNESVLHSKKIQSKIALSEEIKRDIIQSVKSLVFISLFLAGGIYCQHLGFTIRPQGLTPVTAVIWFVVSMLIFDTWFYWGHRLIHTKLLYRWVHAWHHRSTTPTVWSNNSDTFIDDVILQSYFFFALFVLPMPGVILIAHKIYDQITGMIGHSGYEYSAGYLSRFPFPMLGVTFHDQHHESFRYNYATHFSVWDRIMKTMHPDYDQKIKDFEKQSINSRSKSELG
jgi:Delta7-sterol 5-desaturase